MDPNFNLTDYICRYEEGNISEREYYELFQYLVDSGMAWKLQGYYGRQAAMMLEQGHLLSPDRLNASESPTEPPVPKRKRKGGRKSGKQVGALVKMSNRKVEGLGMIIRRTEDVPHDGHPTYNNIIEEMKQHGIVGWGVIGSTHHNFVLVQWFEAPSEYTSHSIKVQKQWYPDKWVKVVSPAPNKGIFNEA